VETRGEGVNSIAKEIDAIASSVEAGSREDKEATQRRGKNVLTEE